MSELCLDTSSATKVALVRDGVVLAHAENDSTRRHAESVTPLVREVLHSSGVSGPLAEAGITSVLVGTGPAPFTGLRAGLVTARVLARAAGAEVYGASSLDIVARQALDLLPPDAEVVVITDARRHELYWARYRAEGPDDVRAVDGPRVSTPRTVVNAMRELDALLVPAGTVPDHAVEALQQVPLGPEVSLDPSVLVRIVASRLARGQTQRLGTEPLYLRRPDIQGQPTAAL